MHKIKYYYWIQLSTDVYTRWCERNNGSHERTITEASYNLSWLYYSVLSLKNVKCHRKRSTNVVWSIISLFIKWRIKKTNTLTGYFCKELTICKPFFSLENYTIIFSENSYSWAKLYFHVRTTLFHSGNIIFAKLY